MDITVEDVLRHVGRVEAQLGSQAELDAVLGINGERSVRVSGAEHEVGALLVQYAARAISEVGPNDFLIDLGSGDGRIVIAAALNYGARGLGVDIDSVAGVFFESRRGVAH